MLLRILKRPIIDDLFIKSLSKILAAAIPEGLRLKLSALGTVKYCLHNTT